MHTKRPTARGGNKTRRFGSLCHNARGAASACFPLPFSLSPFFSTRLYLEPLCPWLSGRKSFRRRRTRPSGRRVRRVHAARPMRRRVPVPIALRLVLVLVLLVLASPPPPPPPRPCFASLACLFCRLGPPSPRFMTPRLGFLQEQRSRGRLTTRPRPRPRPRPRCLPALRFRPRSTSYARAMAGRIALSMSPWPASSGQAASASTQRAPALSSYATVRTLWYDEAAGRKRGDARHRAKLCGESRIFD
jgi:hypothetical protein